MSAYIKFVVFNMTLFGFFGLSEALATTEKNWQFRVFLDGEEIGYHKVHLSHEGDEKRVRVEANFKVNFLFITAYRYQHETEEIWQGSCLAEIQSSTNDNGEQLFIRSLNADQGFAIQTHNGQQQLQGCVRSFAYWDPELLKADRLLNTQTGEYQQVKMIELGNQPIEIDGQNVDAWQYRLLVEDKSIDLWYTSDRNWIALKSITEGGYRISYYPSAKVY